MRLEWDGVNTGTNFTKHGVAFDLARRAWDDPVNDVTEDRVVHGERRYHCIGVVGDVTLLVVHTHPNDDEARIRIISARRATRSERISYEQGL